MPESPRRRLPHWHPDGKWLFVTWHLHGSLPQGRYPPPGKLTSGEAFVWMDRYLDTTRIGPMYLAREPIAKIVVACLHRGVTLGHYDLGAYVVMSNHVHALVLPKVAPSKLMQSLKGATAREANRVLGRTGEPLWQAESYDHWVRDDRERERIAEYIENNPVKAGIVQKAGDFRWSSAGERSVETSLDAADTSVRATSKAQQA
jgi:putative transposase